MLALSLRSYPRAMVAKKPAHQGEHEVSRKAIAQGMSECFRSPVCSCAPFLRYLAHETAGAACTRHSLRPRFGGLRFPSTTRAFGAAGTRNYFPVILRCERSEPRRMDRPQFGPSSFEARKSAHLRMTVRDKRRSSNHPTQDSIPI